MSYYCSPCQRWFVNLNGYNCHIRTSSAHNDPDYECDYCTATFSSEYARDQHHEKSGHPYCIPCKRMFNGSNQLLMHQHGRAHNAASMSCPLCQRVFTTASGIIVHLESGTCPSGTNRQQINELVRRLDRNNVITRPMITMPGYDRVETVATERSWNGYAYQCYLCSKTCTRLYSLNKHLQSPAHEQKLYRCPGRTCNREYKLLSGLVQHVESESCGVMRFAQVQQQAKNGIQSFVGRMITG